MKKLLSELRTTQHLCFDLETTGLNVHTDEIVSVAFGFEPRKAYCVVLPQGFEEAKMILYQLKSFLEDPNIMKIGHNLKFDIKFLIKYDIHVQGPLFDTQVAHYLINPDNKKHGLKFLSEQLLNIKQTKIEELIGGKKNKQLQRDIRQVPVEVLSDYACQDIDMTLRLKAHLEPELKKNGLENVFNEIEMPLVYVLAQVEYEGVNIDTRFLLQCSVNINIEIANYEKNLNVLAGKVINFNSTAQVSNLLFDDFNIDPIGKKLKSGRYSTTSEILKKLALTHELIPLLIKYREAIKLRTTFIEKLLKCVSSVTGRLHTNFNQTVTSTGRLSSSNPNLQNIPKKQVGTGSIIRKAFVPRNENFVIIAADLSQIELRVMAHYSQDPALLYAYHNEIDIHIATAAKMHGVSIDEIGSKDSRRSEAKSINFGLIYGMSSLGLSQKLTEQLGREVTELEAKEKIEKYFEQFKGVAAFIGDAKFYATCNGYAETLTGRKRFLPELDSNNKIKRSAAQRNSVNAPIQGTAADLIKIAMVSIHKEIQSQKLQSRMILQVHDELVFDVPKDEETKMTELIKTKMESAMKLRVPLEVEIKSGDNWLEAH